MNLNNKTVVLTGANGGLGSAIARHLARAGAHLVLVGIGQESLDRQVAELSDGRHRYCGLSLDLSRQTDMDELVSFCEGLPEGIDALVNSAGLNTFAMLEDCTTGSIDRLLKVNLAAPIMLTSALLPLLRSRPESLVVNIGSVLGAIGNPGYAAYCASKGGLARFSEALRRELSGTPVKVLHVSPRVIQTAMNSTTVNSLNQALGNRSDPPDAIAALLVGRILAGRYGEVNVGWPERLFVKINALLPGLVDRNFRTRLQLIERAARQEAVSATATMAVNAVNAASPANAVSAGSNSISNPVATAKRGLA